MGVGAGDGRRILQHGSRSFHGEDQLPAEALPPQPDGNLRRDRACQPHQPDGRGRSILAQDPENMGSLGIAISEAVEVAAKSGGTTKYSIGSCLNHVLLHQTVIGEEALIQMERANDYPDIVIGCVGGGSNYAGIAFPFVGEALRKGLKTRFLAAEPMACPSMTKGVYAYDFGDSVGMAPIVKMHTLGHDFMPPGIHAGGLRYQAWPR